MYDAAITWAQEYVDLTVSDVVPLEGGMTSAMLSVRSRTGGASVLG